MSGEGSVSCEEVRRAMVEDDPPQGLIREHAGQCEACAGIIARDAVLTTAVAEWRESTSEAPDLLRTRVMGEVKRRAAKQRRVAPRPAESRHPTTLWSWPTGRGWLAAAATVLVVLLAGLVAWPDDEPEVLSVGGGLVVADALEEARRAERAHAEAIAALATAAEPVLARSGDPSTPPREAARLRAYRDRLASLDDAITQVRGFLETNPGHAASRTMLLAAYIDKTELLREILEREQPRENA